MKTLYKIGMIISISIIYSCSYKSDQTIISEKEIIDNAVLEKTERIGYLILASEKAEDEGYSIVSTYLKNVVNDEIQHLKIFTVKNKRLKKNTKNNLRFIMRLEKNSYSRTYNVLLLNSIEKGDTSFSDEIKKMINDEKRHYAGLTGLLTGKNK